MHGKLTLDGGALVSARMENGAHIDAATSGADVAAIEIEVTNLVVHLGEQPSYRGEQTLSLSMRPTQLRDFLAIVAHKTGYPLFTEPEWQKIQAAMQAGIDHANERTADDGSTPELSRVVAEWTRLAWRIKEALLRG